MSRGMLRPHGCIRLPNGIGRALFFFFRRPVPKVTPGRPVKELKSSRPGFIFSAVFAFYDAGGNVSKPRAHGRFQRSGDERKQKKPPKRGETVVRALSAIVPEESTWKNRASPKTARALNLSIFKL